MIWGAPYWVGPALAVAALAFGVVVWSYRHPGADAGARRLAGALKITGVVALLLCLTEPLMRRVRATPGANQLLVFVDDSQSLSVRDGGTDRPRSELVRELVADEAAWLLRAGQNFDVQRYAFDGRVRLLPAATELTFEGRESALGRALARIAARSGDRPVAGVVFLSDGVSTDTIADDLPWESMPPVYPVVLGSTSARDVGVTQVDVSQSNFEESPVTLRASVATVGCAGESITVELRDGSRGVVESKLVTADDESLHEVRFHAPPETSGIHAYSVTARLADEGSAAEATGSNNERWAVADRGAGPYRVLYVSGRPNWEFKFLRRALQEDPEVDLVGLLRIARRQPKFSFRDSRDRRNQLWGGFDNRDEESAEEYDEPVLMRVGTRDEFELRAGFPGTTEDLFLYDALVIDDLEASFFTRDQMTLIEQFVSRRGGGFLALGGRQSFVNGGYRGTPLGDLLPVYLESPEGRSGATHSLELTREGWLEPWVRLRSTELAERKRLDSMPDFRTLNRVSGVKPGGIVLVESRDERGTERPALVVQRFGKGRAAALTIGDMWRWDLRRRDPQESDLGTAWRQMLRWLVSDVPRRVELGLARTDDSSEVRLRAALRDESFDAVHNAALRIEIQPPEGEPFELDPVPSATEAGVWEASFVPRASGPYQALLHAVAEDGSELGSDETGWVSEPEVAEFRRLEPDRALLEAVARRTGGTLLEPGDLESFAADLASQDVPISEEELDPLWHRWWVFLIAIVCLCAEWGVRRFHGLP